MIPKRCLPVFCVLVCLLAPVPVVADTPAIPPAVLPQPRVAGLVVRVEDLDQALTFYREVAGFETVRMDKPKGRADLKNGEVELWLVDVESTIHHDFPGTSEAHLNVQVAKLDDTLADLARRGVPSLLEKPITGLIGPNMPVTDPSGNILYMVQLDAQKDKLPRPKVFNYGITVPNMAVARKFYEGLLGFQVYSETFYPPVIPYVPSGAMQVVLHEGATGPSAAPTADTAQMNLILLVDDLDAACRDLEARGGKIRSKTGVAGSSGLGSLGGHAELMDPFGNVHVLVARPSGAKAQAVK